MSSGSGLVSVVVPAHDAEATLGETLRSALAQEEVALEILVVDDGSTDATSDVALAAGEPVRLVRQPQSGVGAARNRGVAEARGRWIAFLDADDLWAPAKLRLQLEALATGWPQGLCYTGVRAVDAEGVPLPSPPAWCRAGPRPTGWVFDELLWGGNAVATSSVLVSREQLDAVGPFRTDPRESEDYDLWLRVARQVAFVHLDRPLVEYRLLEESYSHKDPAIAHLRTLRTMERNAARFEAGAPLGGRVRLRQRKAAILADIARDLAERGEDERARRWLGEALRTWPASTEAAAALALLLPDPARNAARRLRSLLRR